MASNRIIPTAFAFSNVTINIPGLGDTPVTEIAYSDTLEFGELRVNAGYIVDTTSGEYSAEASFSVDKAVHSVFLKSLADAAPGGRINEYEFDISVSYARNADDPTITDELISCKYAGGESSGSAGTDALVVPVTLHLKYIKWNGIGLLGDAAPF